jgi:tetratricopeptide (TPR) repeat protein
LAALFLYAAQGAAGVSSAAWAQGAPAAGAPKTAEDYMREGRDHAQKDRNEEARMSYLEAWKLKKSFDLACNLGLVESKLQRSRDALEHLTYCEQNYPTARDEALTAKFEKLRAEIQKVRAEVGAARAQVTRDDGESPEGARVFVDGQPVGRVGADGKVEQPLLTTGEFYVDAGSRRFSASLKGCADASVVLGVPKGGTVAPALLLSCKKKVNKGLVYAGIGVAAVGVGAGIGALVYSGSRRDDGQPIFDELVAKDGLGACLLPKNSVKCAELESAVSDWSLFRGIGIGGLALGGAAAAATVVYVLVGGSAPKSADTGVQASFGVMPGGGGAVVRGTF